MRGKEGESAQKGMADIKEKGWVKCEGSGQKETKENEIIIYDVEHTHLQ